MRRLDGLGDARTVPEARRPRVLRDRPLFGALVSAALVMSIALPVWLVSDYGPRSAVADQRADRPEATAPTPRGAESASTATPDRVAPRPTRAAPAIAPETPLPAPTSAPDVAASASADVPVEQPSERGFAEASAPPPPPPPPPPAAAAPPVQASESAEIMVTGSRVVANRADMAQPRARLAAPALAARDWNNCTVSDSRRDIEACRGTFEAVVPKSARSFVRDGVKLAWRGDWDGATAAFDRAIARSPASAFAYYNRSLVLRRRGETQRADADKARAIELDGRYRAASD